MHRHSAIGFGSRRRARRNGLRARAIFLGLVVLGLLYGVFVPAAPASAASQPGWVLAWGNNHFAQLGLAEDAAYRTEAKSVSAAVDSGVIAIAAGANQSLALKADGTVLSWGDNSGVGLLGQGSNANYLDPGPVQGISGATSIAAGRFHGLAVAGGNVFSWGDNAYGQLGVPVSTTCASGNTCSNVAVQVADLAGAKAVGAGWNHSLAIMNDGTVRAWGNNAFGALGDGTITRRPTPVTVVGPGGSGTLGNIIAVDGGEAHSLALAADGTVYVWGQNGQGQHGHGSADTGNHTVPSQVPGLSGIVAIAAGYRFNLALRGDGTVWAWGQNENGQLGNGSIATDGCTCYATPTPVSALAGVTAIAAGYAHGLAVLADGTVRGWGNNGGLQLGHIAPTKIPTPIQVPGLTDVRLVAGGNLHSFVVRAVPQFTLQVSTDGDGTGTVTPGTGTHQQGAQVSLTPQAADGSVFTGWTVDGVAAGNAVPLAITMGANHSVVATFARRMVPQFTLTVSTDGTGSGTVTPGGGTHPHGTQVSLTPQATGDSVFVGWTVDGVFAGHAVPLTLTMDRDHTVVATFNKPPTFCDVNPGDPYFAAIRQLAARGVIRGFDPGDGQLCFGPNDNTLRAQMAALIARPFGWDLESHNNPFSDRGPVDDNLWASVGSLAHYEVARGYKPETCVALGVQPPCYGPTDYVLHAQVISFITRGMVEKGYWQYQPDNGATYPNIAADSGHRVDIATWVHYAGALPGTGGTGKGWGVWDQPATRGWFAEALWRALDSYFGLDRTP